ncbi:hypothetical protein Rumeso_01528 [Rubellimicrobium mesophilum DSM 19309]|uniref:Uncharacterized protein n=1 Tax=Rubellimicrobium mesophilum DSM 19309 TaxID=442562 RepID=A0A017HRS8_9RHOB|nr:hypothetical protein Rumeso_01528 [Rubellimicrobium mesophilum DSM 19309]
MSCCPGPEVRCRRRGVQSGAGHDRETGPATGDFPPFRGDGRDIAPGKGAALHILG